MPHTAQPSNKNLSCQQIYLSTYVFEFYCEGGRVAYGSGNGVDGLANRSELLREFRVGACNLGLGPSFGAVCGLGSLARVQRATGTVGVYIRVHVYSGHHLVIPVKVTICHKLMMTYLEGQGDLVSRLITPIAHIVTKSP